VLVNKEDFCKLKNPETFIYKAYSVFSKGHYTGSSLVAAESDVEANKIIQEFKNSDLENKRDSWGWEFVNESSHYDQFSDIKGIINSDIRYYG
jgi:hypothetical protein